MRVCFALCRNRGRTEHRRARPGTLRSATLVTVILFLGACRNAQPRDDERITQEVQASLYQNPTLKMRDISVITNTSVVVLVGQVNSEDEKLSAERRARAVRGVKQVINQLVVVGASSKPAPPVLRRLFKTHPHRPDQKGQGAPAT